MKFIINKSRLWVLLIIAVFGTKLMAEGPHVHGQAFFNVALDGESLVANLILTAYDVVGFEYEPSNQEEKAMIKSAVKILKSTDDWLMLENGGCEEQSVKLNNPLMSEHSENNGDGHANFELTIDYKCQSPNELSGVTINLVKHFTEIQQIEVQWLIHDRQGLLNLSASENHVRFQ